MIVNESNNTYDRTIKIKQNEQLAEELHKQIIKKRRVFLHLKIIFGVLI